MLVSAARADDAELAALERRAAREVLGAPVTTAAGEPGYLEVCDRRSDVVTFASGDRGALDSMLTHVNAAIRQQQLLSQIRHDADHDRLTGLPNRQRLAAEIDALLLAETATPRAGLVLAALDGYTNVTDTLGHAASDELLLVTAGLLREHAPPQASSPGWRAVSSPSCCRVCRCRRPSAPPAGCGRPPPPAPGWPGWTSRSR